MYRSASLEELGNLYCQKKPLPSKPGGRSPTPVTPRRPSPRGVPRPGAG